MRHFLLLGSHPWLSLAEAKAVLGGGAPTIIGSVALIERDEWDGGWLQERLAGTIKLGDELFARPLKELTAEQIVAALPEREGTSKLTFAVTVIGVPTSVLQRLPIELKRAMKTFGRSVRWFADKDGDVSPAAVAKLGLTTEGYDIVVAVERGIAHVCLTSHVQNADAWSLRDYGRPARDSKNGMLPPKLARMMVNLGVGTSKLLHQPTDLSLEPTSDSPLTILDPFCGSGTVLMESALMEQHATLIGSDIDAKQVADTNKNLDWMVEKHLISPEQRARINCFPHDARLIDRFVHEPVEVIVTEGFLGTPLRGHEPVAYLEESARSIKKLWEESLMAFAKSQPTNGVVIGVWPELQTPQGRAAVELGREIREAGYQLVDPLEDWVGAEKDLVYARADQMVKRRIVVLKKQ